MTDALESLRQLVEHPATGPEGLEDVYRRVAVRSRRRTGRRVAGAVLSTVVVVLAVLPLLRANAGRPTRVATGPAPGVLASGPRLEYSVPEGWQTLAFDGRRLVVATRPLTGFDVQLALLARADAAFTAFPPDGVVVAVGFDPLEAKYGTNWDGTQVVRAPAYALGPEQALRDGVRLRRGDVPQSIESIASYAGPMAPAERLREAEDIVAGMRLVTSGDASVATAPPVAPAAVAGTNLREVATAGSGDSELALEAEGDCAYLRPVASGSPAAGQNRLGGGCGARPGDSGITVAGPAAQMWPSAGGPPSTAGVFRVGPGVRTVSARTADGRSFPAVLGAGGWGLAVVPGRIVELIATDGGGQQVAEAFVR